GPVSSCGAFRCCSSPRAACRCICATTRRSRTSSRSRWRWRSCWRRSGRTAAEWPERKADPEPSSTPGVGKGHDRAAVPLDDGATQPQAQTEPAVVPRRDPLAEGAEHRLALLFVEARTVVRHLEDTSVAVAEDTDLHRLRPAELERVVEESRHYRRGPATVGTHRHGLRCVEAHAVRLGRETADLPRRDQRQIEVRDPELEGAGVQRGDVDEAGDEVPQPADLAPQRLSVLGGGPRPQEAVDGDLHRRQGIPELVTGDGDQLLAGGQRLRERSLHLLLLGPYLRVVQLVLDG